MYQTEAKATFQQDKDLRHATTKHMSDSAKGLECPNLATVEYLRRDLKKGVGKLSLSKH